MHVPYEYLITTVNLICLPVIQNLKKIILPLMFRASLRQTAEIIIHVLRVTDVKGLLKKLKVV